MISLTLPLTTTRSLERSRFRFALRRPRYGVSVVSLSHSTALVFLASKTPNKLQVAENSAAIAGCPNVPRHFSSCSGESIALSLLGFSVNARGVCTPRSGEGKSGKGARTLQT